jgi:methylamine--corrinoid protein Co-methyltransferase
LICSLAPGPIKGGFAGGPEGTAILSVANLFQETLAIRGQFYIFFPHDIRFSCNSSREMLWTASIAGQAISRNTHALKLISPYSAAGPCTEMVAYEETAECLAIVTSGADVDYGSVAKNKYLDYCSGFEAQFAHEVCHAAAGMKRKDASILAKEILKRYESRMQDPPLGRKFQDCYDVKRVTPTKDYLDLHSRIRRELMDIGLNMALEV